MDVFERLGGENWNLIEVKSSTSVKDAHLPDVAIQGHMLHGTGPEIERSHLMHVNGRYVYNGLDLDLDSYFTSSDMTEQALVM